MGEITYICNYQNININYKIVMNVKIINKSPYELPKYETIASAGMDIRAHITTDVGIRLLPNVPVVVKTGLFIELPVGYEAQVRPRSGLAAKCGITVLNSPGTIDADYRGEIGVILINLGNKEQIIMAGDRIAQLVFAKFEQAKFEEVEVLSTTERGEGGFGSTGKK